MSGILNSVSAVRIFARDIERARRFYGELLELEETVSGPGYAVFDVAGVDMVIEAVAPDDPEAGDLIGRFLAVSFDVDDIDAAYRLLTERGVAFDGQPEKQDWGGVLALPKDPDGNVLTLVG